MSSPHAVHLMVGAPARGRCARAAALRAAALLLALAGCAPPGPLKVANSDAPGADGGGAGEDTADDGVGAVDADADGAPASADCDDADAARYPGAPEQCNGQDDDCDAEIDEGVLLRWYTDGDGDGFGAPGGEEGCAAPAGTVDNDADCDDLDPLRAPGQDERCNGQDDDCDAEIDEGVVVPTWWPDGDGDGVGGDGAPVEACDPGPGWATSSGDCDDADPTVFPGKREDCDARDDDCSGLADDSAACPCVVEHRGAQPYLFCTTGTDWAGAQATCAAVGYHLADVEDSAEDAWLAATAATYASTYWWMGANDLTAEGAWTWESGAAWSYTNWCASEPNNGHGLECVPTTEEDCGVLGWQSGGCWNDFPCSCAAGQGQPYYSICEA
jgi:hypothetical protein